ncbi:RNA polymerase sigma-70 factor (sigma-E family) [Halopolyspora algeriensis]|uniref:RNA polymerase sigma-70 factor (Sigma-E family) n=1 Tax=Halopolyspora algeriensis TaxID=1500506 RepID=A0A368VY21_9ACTN|nr:SigE family RNA polymerase sigma factor [Halopolyspora algeriensis]RCW47098.1 RNA polymerase sigma-70 factor (sigma-E family) [Halopolyspora algeriensis]TQM48185.1 RNA polymerase sigma-70 factor (sigma-E family) [Halopolyspora algeriensis]
MDEREEQEFAEYFAARREAVRRMAYMMCGDWHRADDLAQTAFIALHRRWRKVRDKGSLDAYVRRTLTRAVIDESRRPWRRERAVEVLPDTPSDSEDVATSVATRRTLMAGLRKVPPKQRAVLVLRYLEGLDVAGVAEIMKCSEGNVKSQSARGLETLREALGDEFDHVRPTSGGGAGK